METTAINNLQFLFQIFLLLSFILNIPGTCKLNCILWNCTLLVFYGIAQYFKFCYQQTLRKIYKVVTKAEHEVIILYEFGKRW